MGTFCRSCSPALIVNLNLSTSAEDVEAKATSTSKAEWRYFIEAANAERRFFEDEITHAGRRWLRVFQHIADIDPVQFFAVGAALVAAQPVKED